ncbi:MAG: ATP-binding cassette domain-containing protein [Candidatus Omnitrophota bacterium]|jgi:ABC-2 type transport system ATP-binding protein|nr:MAG: ATP-binding cassette domain-containing protein [Candidatus Omnitrophota bacterium]
MIVAEKLKKVFSRVVAIEDVSFEVAEGEILGFLGPNGAGKTTTMRILTGYTPPTSGRAVIAGFDVREASLQARQQIGYLPENTPLYREMDVLSYLGFAAQVKGIPPGDRARKMREAMEETGIQDVAQRTINKLSKGYKQRVGLAQALLGDPKVLILDEPTVGLDPNQIREIRELIKNMAGKRTVILSTHILPEVSMICERVMIIHEGRLVASDAVGHLKSRLARSRTIQLTLAAPAAEVNDALAELRGIQKIECKESDEGDGRCRIRVETDPEMELSPDIVNRVVGKGWKLYEIQSLEPTLEDIFVDIIAGEKEV